MHVQGFGCDQDNLVPQVSKDPEKRVSAPCLFRSYRIRSITSPMSWFDMIVTPS